MASEAPREILRGEDAFVYEPEGETVDERRPVGLQQIQSQRGAAVGRGEDLWCAECERWDSRRGDGGPDVPKPCRWSDRFFVSEGFPTFCRRV